MHKPSDDYQGRLVPILQTLHLSFPDGKTIVMLGSDALYNKALVPVQPGGSVTGILQFAFDKVPRTVFAG